MDYLEARQKYLEPLISLENLIKIISIKYKTKNSLGFYRSTEKIWKEDNRILMFFVNMFLCFSFAKNFKIIETDSFLKQIIIIRNDLAHKHHTKSFSEEDEIFAKVFLESHQIIDYFYGLIKELKIKMNNNMNKNIFNSFIFFYSTLLLQDIDNNEKTLTQDMEYWKIQFKGQIFETFRPKIFSKYPKKLEELEKFTKAKIVPLFLK